MILKRQPAIIVQVSVRFFVRGVLREIYGLVERKWIRHNR